MNRGTGPKDDLPRNWWTRPCGGREVLQIAFPLIISTGSWSLMHFTDRMLLTWHSSTEIAAAMPAGILHLSFLCLPFGIAGYLNTFVAQYDGAGQPGRIGSVVWQGIWLGLFMVPLFLAATPLASAIFAAAHHTPAIAQCEVIYFRTLTYGAGGAVIACALSTFFTGRGNNLPIMQVNIAAALLNVVLDYALIFGHGGFPEMGIEGAGWATVISLWFKGIAYMAIMLMPVHRAKYGTLSGWRLNGPMIRRLIRFGGPNGVHMLVEVSAFTFFILLVGNLGEEAMAATALAFSINALSFIPLLGVGLSVSTLVGRQLGRNLPDLAARATRTALTITLGYMGIIVLLYVGAPGIFLLPHMHGVQDKDFESIRQLVIILLRYIALYGLFDVLNVTFVGALKGAGDTRFILLTHLIVTPCTVGMLLIGIRWYQADIFWCWTVVTIWVIALGVIFSLRFLQGKWRSMRVIEPELLAQQGEDVEPLVTPSVEQCPAADIRPTSTRS